jgi:hypothetical protein
MTSLRGGDQIVELLHDKQHKRQAIGTIESICVLPRPTNHGTHTTRCPCGGVRSSRQQGVCQKPEQKGGERHHHIADNGIARVAVPPACGRASASLRPEFTCMGIKARCQRNGAKCTSGCVADARYNPKDQWDEHLSARQMRPFIYGRVNSVTQNANANANKWGRALWEPVATLRMRGIDVRLCKQTRGF